MKKNVAGQSVGCQMITASDGSNFTGAVTVEITKDNGTQTTGSVGSGACTHEGNGYHSYAPAQAETNADHIAFTFHGTGAITATVQVYTSFPQTGDAFADTTNIKTRLPAALTAGGFMKASLEAILDSTFTEGAAGRIAAAFKQFFNIATPTSTMNTITSLTNAPTAGDLTATMKASVTTAATAATPTAAAVTADVGITQAGADKVWGTTVRALTDKSGFSLSAAGIQAIYDFATSLLTTAGSFGKFVLDRLDVVLSTRAPSSTALSTAQWTNTRAANLDNLDATVSSRSTLGGTAQTGDVYALLNSAQAEPAAVPAANASPVVKLGYVFAKMRNKRLTTATSETLRNDADSADIATATLSDDGTTFTKGEDA